MVTGFKIEDLVPGFSFKMKGQFHPFYTLVVTKVEENIIWNIPSKLVYYDVFDSNGNQLQTNCTNLLDVLS